MFTNSHKLGFFFNLGMNDKHVRWTCTVLGACSSSVWQRRTSPAVVIAYLMKSRRWTFDQSYQWVKERRPSVDLNEGIDFHLLSQLDCSYKSMHRRFRRQWRPVVVVVAVALCHRSQTNVQPAFPAFNTATATTSIFTRAYIPQPNQFTFGAAAQIENAPQNLVSSGPNYVNPNATDVWVLNFCFLACDILLSTIEQYMHPGMQWRRMQWRN
ncbi:putative protein-tyrosine-phosphatase [Helianthus debilis subsp. tardiflorus]